MSQRESGYARKERDLYETPEWVTAALLPHLPVGDLDIWEPAAGSEKMVRVLRAAHHVYASDIEPSDSVLAGDFLAYRDWPESNLLHNRRAIITNPPYELATAFCEHALRLTEPSLGVVAMLLRTDFDHAKRRSHLFHGCAAFSKKLILMRRIAWFVEENGKPKASPSFNHAWFIWDWRHDGPPTLAYAP
jgi:hypothetical protein